MTYVLADDNLYADTQFFWPSSVTLFGETVSFSDFVSTLMLLTCSVLSLLIYLKRQQQTAPGAIIWGLMSMGLFFLAQDEFFSFHENFDHWIHEITGMKQTQWTTQIDTLVVLLYVIVAIALLWRYNAEIRKCAPNWKLFLVTGFAIALFGLFFDTIENLLPSQISLFGEKTSAIAHRIEIEAENLCELGAEVVFVVFFVSAYGYVRASRFNASETKD